MEGSSRKYHVQVASTWVFRTTSDGVAALRVLNSHDW